MELDERPPDPETRHLWIDKDIRYDERIPRRNHKRGKHLPVEVERLCGIIVVVRAKRPCVPVRSKTGCCLPLKTWAPREQDRLRQAVFVITFSH